MTGNVYPIFRRTKTLGKRISAHIFVAVPNERVRSTLFVFKQDFYHKSDSV